MQVKKDEYRAEMVGIMLSHEVNPEETHYAAHLSHWFGDSKPINVEADVLTVLQKAYRGEYVEVNELEHKMGQERCLFWNEYKYQDHPLLFVRLPHLTNLDIVEILRLLDMAYGNTNQETPDWALEFQILTRMLAQQKCLLANPVYLDISDEEFRQELLRALPDMDREDYASALDLSQSCIDDMFRDSKT